MDEEKFLHIVRSCVGQSDISLEQLTAYARVFVEAHERAPGGLSIEVGTREGGSALVWLLLLREIYGDAPPPLFTVDPYGGKDYEGTHIYHDGHYLLSKAALGPYPNHAHFLLRSMDFFAPLAHRPYWRNRVEYKIDNFSFVFLDGEHQTPAITEEMQVLLGPDRLMAPTGTILIDNANHAGGTWAMLEGYAATRVDAGGQGAVIR